MEKIEQREVKRRRNKQAINEDVMRVVEQLVVKHGFEHIQLQDVCRDANITHNTFYRNYGDMKTLFERFIKEYDYWLNEAVVLGNMKELGQVEFTKSMFRSLWFNVRANKVMQKVLLWGLEGKSHIPKELSRFREREFSYPIRYYNELFEGSGIDIQSVFAMVVCATYYLSIHVENNVKTFALLDFSKPGEEERFVATIAKVFDLVFAEKRRLEARAELIEQMKNDGLSQEQIDKYLAILEK